LNAVWACAAFTFTQSLIHPSEAASAMRTTAFSAKSARLGASAPAAVRPKTAVHAVKVCTIDLCSAACE
jgi:hypothetical protein